MPQIDQHFSAVERFVASLWQHVRMRALGVDASEALMLSSRAVRKAYDAILPHERKFIGEELVAYILNYTIQNLSRKHCIACLKYAGCAQTDGGACERFTRDQEAYATGRALLATSIYMLDGVYGIDAQQMLTLACHFLDAMAGESGQVGIS